MDFNLQKRGREHYDALKNYAHINPAVLDADGMMYFARQLELIEQEVYAVEYPEYKFRKLFPIDYRGGLPIQNITYRSYDRMGSSKVINNYRDQNIPRTELKFKEETVQIKDVATALGYSLIDIAAAKFTGQSLDSELIYAGMQNVEQTLNLIAYNGDSEYNIIGLFNHPSIPRANVVAGASTYTTWNKKTPSEIFFDVLDLVFDIISSTNQVEIPDTLVLPTDQYGLLLQPMTIGGIPTNQSIVKYITDNISYIKNIESDPFLKGIGTSGKDVMVAYKKDPRKLVYRLPYDTAVMPFMPVSNLWFESQILARTGGLTVRYPLSIKIAEGI